MFASHSSLSHGHSHSHGHGHGHGHGHEDKKDKKHKHKHGDKHKHREDEDAGVVGLLEKEGKEEEHEHEHKEHDHEHSHKKDKKKEKIEKDNSNLHAVSSLLHPSNLSSIFSFDSSEVFLHVLGDALGSVGAVGAGLIIKFVNHPWKVYADPTFSLLLSLAVSSLALSFLYFPL
jgi:zinc transporter 1